MARRILPGASASTIASALLLAGEIVSTEAGLVRGNGNVVGGIPLIDSGTKFGPAISDFIDEDGTIRDAIESVASRVGSVLEPDGAASVGFVEDLVGAVPTTVDSKLKEAGFSVTAFYNSETRVPGVTDDTPAWNQLITRINSIGSQFASANIAIRVAIPPGTHNLKSGLTVPILVSNVVFDGAENAIILHRDGRIFTLGSPSTFIENFDLNNCNFLCSYAENPSLDQAIVWCENVARIRISRPRTQRVRRLVGCNMAAGTVVTNIHIFNPTGNGIVEGNYVDLKNVNGGIGADVRIFNAALFAVNNSGVPANPSIVPIGVTNITQANPGLVTTAGPHGLTTGEKVVLHSVNGMTQVNNVQYAITVVSPTSFTLGVSTAGFSAYTSGGYAPKMHFSADIDTAMLSVEGSWDTMVIDGGIVQHWAYTNRHKAGEGKVQSFVKVNNHYSDYIGHSMCRIEPNGGAITVIDLNDNWVFSLNGPAIDFVGGAGSVPSPRISNLIVGLCGQEVLKPMVTAVKDLSWIGGEIAACCRILGGVTYGILPVLAAATTFTVKDIIWKNPEASYGEGADDTLRPYVGIFNNSSDISMIVEGCMFNSRVQDYAVTFGGAFTRVSGNSRLSGSLPEYIASSPVAVGCSPYSWKNTLGQPVYLRIAGGTVTGVAVGGVTLATATDAAVLVGRNQTAVITHSSEPTVTALPIEA